MDRLGPISVRQEKTPSGGYRVTMMLPTDPPNDTYPVDAEGKSLADALTLALDRAEDWARKK
jgi:hypothetical protein